MKCFPSGRKRGLDWRVSPSAKGLSSTICPPVVATRLILGPAEKRIIPSRLQLPGSESPASQIVTVEPPVTSIFRSRPLDQNATNRLSGDQNGENPPWVPGKGFASAESKRRSHSEISFRR